MSVCMEDCLQKPHPSVAGQKSSILKAQSNTKEDYIIKMCRDHCPFRDHLEAVIRDDGTQIESNTLSDVSSTT